MKSMKLYDHVERIVTDLKAQGYGDDALLDVERLSRLDQFHYHGTAAVDEAIAACAIRPDASVLEVGSGVGGPARWIAARAGAQVVALELQPDLDALARSLTRRCGLQEKVVHVCGDILAAPPPGAPFDHAVSFLCFLHIRDRELLAARLHQSLKPGAWLYIEDYIAHRPLTASEADDLRVKVQCPYVPSADVYRQTLAEAGFDIAGMTDMTDDWRSFTAERAQAFCDNQSRFAALHGKETADGLADFYQTVAALFAGGGIGGVRLVARRR